MTTLKFTCSEKRAIAILRASRLYEKGIEVHDWIPIAEGLPAESGTYIVTAVPGSGKPVVRTVDFTHFGDIGNWETYFDVLAWKPLPEPYKPEGNKS